MQKISGADLLGCIEVSDLKMKSKKKPMKERMMGQAKKVKLTANCGTLIPSFKVYVLIKTCSRRRNFASATLQSQRKW